MPNFRKSRSFSKSSPKSSKSSPRPVKRTTKPSSPEEKIGTRSERAQRFKKSKDKVGGNEKSAPTGPISKSSYPLPKLARKKKEHKLPPIRLTFEIVPREKDLDIVSMDLDTGKDKVGEHPKQEKKKKEKRVPEHTHLKKTKDEPVADGEKKGKKKKVFVEGNKVCIITFSFASVSNSKSTILSLINSVNKKEEETINKKVEKMVCSLICYFCNTNSSTLISRNTTILSRTPKERGCRRTKRRSRVNWYESIGYVCMSYIRKRQSEWS